MKKKQLLILHNIYSKLYTSNIAQRSFKKINEKLEKNTNNSYKTCDIVRMLIYLNY